jgi:hypothetical protein
MKTDHTPPVAGRMGRAATQLQHTADWSHRMDEAMALIHEPPLTFTLATLLALITVAAAWRGTQSLARGLRQTTHPSGALWVVRGIRGVIVAVGVGALSAGLLFASKGLLAFGVIFLGEELYETGVVLLALRAGLKAVGELDTAHGPAPQT